MRLRAERIITMTSVTSKDPMAFTAKLSRRFYDHFGDELTNEFVDLINGMDTTYKSELREMNELNFARFDAK